MTKEIQLTQGKVALVDDEDFEYLSQWKWYAQRDPKGKCFYAKRSINMNQKKLMTHDILKIVDGMYIDHADRNTLNNTKDNLRLCLPSENSMNKDKLSNNKTGYKGVSIYHGVYRAVVHFHKKQYYLGLFETAKEAAIAYDKKAAELCKEYSFMNFKAER